MSMDDILKVLVESRQQGGSQSSSKGSDPMTDLIGGLLGGGGSGGSQPQTSNQGSGSMGDVLSSLMGGGGNQQAGGLGTIISLLETLTGSGQQTGSAQSPLTSSDSPIMSLIKPYITSLAKKLKISPELAVIVVSFVLEKLLAHHPTSGRNSTQFDLDQLLNQLSTGKLDPNMIKNSGMVEELSQVTGMNQTMAAKSLNTAFTMVGKRALTVAGSPPARTASGGVKRA